MTQQDESTSLPLLVQQAMESARNAAFTISCEPAVGRLLTVLVAHLPHGRIGEAGAGYGAGTAWMADALAPTARLLTVELDATRARSVSSLVAGRSNVEVLEGDWTELERYGPFDLLFIDARPPKYDDADRAAMLLAPGGMAVLDDLTPIALQPHDWREESDPVRTFWLHDIRLRAIEVQVTPIMSVILAVRVS
jgi:predicted O-methyltransferase YrrM